MQQTVTHWNPIAACFDRRMLLQRIGLLVFVLSMPLNVLNGHGKGMIADHDHFQGWKVAVLFCFVIPSWFSLFDWQSVQFLPVRVAIAFTLTMPFVDLSKRGIGRRTANVLKVVGVVSLSFVAFVLWNWSKEDFHGEPGVFWGAIPWLGGQALVVVGALMQKPDKTPVQRKWTFSLRTLFIALTGAAVSAAVVSVYPQLAGAVVTFVTLVAAMAAPSFLHAPRDSSETLPESCGSSELPGP